MNDALSESFTSRLSYNHFFVIGRAGLDLYPEPDGTSIEKALLFKADLGGSAGNIAVAMSQLGTNVSMLTCVSDDPIGRFTLRRLQSYDINISHCRLDAGESRNTLAVAETIPDNSHVIIYRHKASDLQISEKDCAKIPFADIGGIVITGTALTDEPSRTAVLSTIRTARKFDLPIILDLDYRPDNSGDQVKTLEAYREAITHSSIVVGNEVEYAYVAPTSMNGLCYAKELPSQKNIHIAIYKMGAKGSQTFTKKGRIVTPSFPTKMRKPFGAGDAFLGGVLAALAEHMTLENALIRGAAGASIVVGRAGCASAMPTNFAVEQVITMKGNHAQSLAPEQI